MNSWQASVPELRRLASRSGLLAALMAAGCVAAPPRTEQVYSQDHAAAWSTQIQQLPVEVHGAAPNLSAFMTVAGIDHGMAGGAAMPISSRRVVLYIGGGAAPEPAQYCAAASSAIAESGAGPNQLPLRLALCDGPREVAYVGDSVPEAASTIASINRAVNRLKSGLIEDLPSRPKPA